MTSGNGKYDWKYSQDSRQVWDASDGRVLGAEEEDDLDRGAWIGGVILAGAVVLGFLVGWFL